MASRSLLGRFLGLRGPVGTHVHTATDGRDILLNDPDGWEVSAPWLWWAGPAGGNGTGGPFGNPPPGATDPLGLAALPAVTRCTSIICNTISGLPWRVMKGYDQQFTPDWITDPQLTRFNSRWQVDATPENGRLSAVEFWSEWITSALWFGDGFAYSDNYDYQNQTPRPPLYILHPHSVELDSRSGTWGVGPNVGQETGGFGYWIGPVRIPDEAMLHLRGEPPYEGGRGTGVIDRHSLDLGLAATVRSYASGVFSSGVPAGYLKVNAPNLTQQQADDLKTKWLANHGNSSRSIAVLNATTDFTPISISPIDAQLDTARTWGLRDIALAFGVPPYMLGVPGDSSTYANVESRMTELRTFTLLPWIRRIESALDAQFPRGTELKIAVDAQLRAETSTRFSAYESALRAGWLTVDEVRALEDRPPLPEQVTTDPEAVQLEPDNQPEEMVVPDAESQPTEVPA